MATVLAALLPIAAILALGKVSASLNLLTREGWIGLERITYFVLFPALIVSKLAVADFSGIDWRMPTALIGAQLLLSLATILVAGALGTARDRIGVYVQSAARWNTFIALALAQDLFGAQGLALVAVSAAVMIPTANILSVSALMHFSNEAVKPVQMLKKLAVNPLVLACAIGIGLNVSRLPLPGQAFEILDLLAQATIALGLLTTGAAIDLKGRGSSMTAATVWSVVRLAGLPLIAGTIAISFGLSGDVLYVILIATAVPTAVNGTILARQLGADATLAANLIAFQTIGSILSISVVLWMAGIGA
ncbi:MAG: AEC family transporter [Henriciella sp.]|nr:AEC family transporter [Henriciella sp.]